MPLERVTGLSSGVERTAGLVGAALAALLVAVVGAADALVANAAGLALAAVVLGLGTAGLLPATVTTARPERYARRLREGWAFLRGDPVILALTSMIAVTNLLDVGLTAVLLPVWAETSGAGVAAVGLLLAVMAGTSLVGSLLAAAWAQRMPRFASTAVAWALMPFGGLVAGGLLAVLGLEAALLAAGTLYLVATLAPLADRRFRAMERPAATARLAPERVS